MSQELIEAFTSIREEEAVNLAKGLLEGGTDPLDVIEICKDAVRIIGDRFESGQVFLPELIMAGEIMASISSEVTPLLQAGEEVGSRGKILFGTVEGDIHDIGKDIVVFLLEANGFEVIDLGVDIPAATFVEKLRESEATVVGLSGLLSLAFDSMKATVQAIEEAGLRAGVKIMIGGGPVDERVCKYAMAAVTFAQKWFGE